MSNIADILKKPIVKISSLNGISVLVRILGGLITSKAIAAYVGAGGMALVGNFRDFLTSLEFFSTMGMPNGIIKYTAENEKDKEKLYTALGTILLTLFCASMLISGILLFLSAFFSKWIFRDQALQYGWIVKLLAFTLPWYAGSLVFMAVLNGLGKFKQVIYINITGNIVGIAVSLFLMRQFNTEGALLALIASQVMLFIFSFYVIWHKFPGLPFLRFSYFDLGILRGLMAYSIMTLVSAILTPLVYPGIRNHLIKNFSPDTAGHWDAVNRLSTFYMMFATTMVSIYFLPKLSVAQSHGETKRVFYNYYKSMLPLFAVCLLILYFLREFVVLVVFNEEFLPMTELFLWQLLGDFFKVGSLILGYQFFAKKLTIAFIVTEILSFCVLYFSSIFLIDKYGAEGAVMGHTVTFFIYWIMLAIYFRKDLI